MANQNHVSQSNKDLIKARQVYFCPEIGTVQPQLVVVVVVDNVVVVALLVVTDRTIFSSGQ